MQGIRIRRFGGLPRAAVLAAGVMALSLCASPDTALAEHRNRQTVVKHRHHRHGHRVVPRYYGRGGFVVPRHIHRHHVGIYRPYFNGSVYFAPHRHRHVVYYFPYYGPYGFVEFRPYYYCGDELFFHGGFEYYGPRVGISIGF